MAVWWIWSEKQVSEWEYGWTVYYCLTKPSELIDFPTGPSGKLWCQWKWPWPNTTLWCQEWKQVGKNARNGFTLSPQLLCSYFSYIVLQWGAKNIDILDSFKFNWQAAVKFSFTLMIFFQTVNITYISRILKFGCYCHKDKHQYDILKVLLVNRSKKVPNITSSTLFYW